MTSGRNATRNTVIGLLLAGIATVSLPGVAAAQDDETRLRRLEAEIRALQRAVFPGGGGRYFAPEVDTSEGQQPTPQVGTPSNSATADMLARLDALEAQLAQMTAREEENAHAIAQLRAQLDEALASGAGAVDGPAGQPSGVIEPARLGQSASPAGSAPARATPAPAPARTTPTPAPAAARTSTPTPTPAAARTATPAPSPARAGAAATPAPTPARAGAAATPAPTPARAGAAAASGPTPARVAAVQAVAKPSTDDAGDDEYTYGYRLWEAGYFPEARQQLSLFLQKYPDHPRTSFGRNLLGRAFLDDGQPREAATHFFENYQKDKNGARAADSLLFLSEAMVAIGDTNRACIALAEFSETYPALATGRLKEQYDRDRSKVTCRA
jgi:TolA-binding protein